MIDLTLSTVAGTIKKDRPIVLMILQGEHHLVLYENIFKFCVEFRWVCIVPDISKISPNIIFRMYNRYGVQFFSDNDTAIAYFHTIDAVVTTFAVPHRAHIKTIRFIAIAHELGVPVFELQHGLFQLGISASELGPLIGSGMSNALTALPAPNLVEQKLLWYGEGAIGYPPFSEEIYDLASRSRLVTDYTLVTTNLHWNIFTPSDVERMCEIIAKAVLSIPDVDFVHVPHPSEMGKPHLKGLALRIKNAGAKNYVVRRPKDAAEMSSTIAGARLCISTISTMLLDMEMMSLPTIVLPGTRQYDMVSKFEFSFSAYEKDTVVQEIKSIYYGKRNPLLLTGMLQPFSPAKLNDILNSAIDRSDHPAKISTVVRAIAKYVG